MGYLGDVISGSTNCACVNIAYFSKIIQAFVFKSLGGGGGVSVVLLLKVKY